MKKKFFFELEIYYHVNVLYSPFIDTNNTSQSYKHLLHKDILLH